MRSAVQNPDESKGIALDLTLRELNPNHKYRMALIGLSESLGSSLGSSIDLYQS